MYKLYSVMAIISILVRQFILPNPFDPLGETFNLIVGEIVVPLTPTIANWIAEPVIHIVTFILVGIYYRKGEHEPAWGSFLYLIFYAIHVGLIYIISVFDFAMLAVIVTLILYIAIHIAISVLKSRLLY